MYIEHRKRKFRFEIYEAMNHSFSYYIILFVLKISGIKRDFSIDPVDYKKIRRNDIHHPKGRFFSKNQAGSFMVSGTLVTEFRQQKPTEKLLIFVHGGAFVSGPSKLHWVVVQQIFNHTNHNIWMCDYPKSPEHKISEISANIDLVYQTALEKYKPGDITLIGDSAGGTLIIALIQRLVKNNRETPRKLILVSPVLDASFSNPQIPAIDKTDPMLSVTGLLSAMKMCSENNDLKNAMISPLNAGFDKFPDTILFIAEKDITYPDQLSAVQKFREAGVITEVITGIEMPHVWPYLPFMKESGKALKEIIIRINN